MKERPPRYGSPVLTPTHQSIVPTPSSTMEIKRDIDDKHGKYYEDIFGISTIGERNFDEKKKKG